MIPKIIHYCWFGNNQLPNDAIQCIESWKKYMPDYEIKEWNESNFDVNCCSYVKEAYQEKKWAFISDYARFWILYNYGGIYFDTDVELIKSINDILSMGDGNFMAIEKTENYPVAPGLGIAAVPKLDIYKEILEYYQSHHFKNKDGSLNLTTVCTITTNILLKYGYTLNNNFQTVKNINIYPYEFFCPIDSTTMEMEIVKETHSIHHYKSSWWPKEEIEIRNNKNKLQKKYGRHIGSFISCFYKLPYKVRKKINKIYRKI